MYIKKVLFLGMLLWAAPGIGMQENKTGAPAAKRQRVEHYDQNRLHTNITNKTAFALQRLIGSFLPITGMWVRSAFSFESHVDCMGVSAAGTIVAAAVNASDNKTRSLIVATFDQKKRSWMIAPVVSFEKAQPNAAGIIYRGLQVNGDGSTIVFHEGNNLWTAHSHKGTWTVSKDPVIVMASPIARALVSKQGSTVVSIDVQGNVWIKQDGIVTKFPCHSEPPAFDLPIQLSGDGNVLALVKKSQSDEAFIDIFECHNTKWDIQRLRLTNRKSGVRIMTDKIAINHDGTQIAVTLGFLKGFRTSGKPQLHILQREATEWKKSAIVQLSTHCAFLQFSDDSDVCFVQEDNKKEQFFVLNQKKKWQATRPRQPLLDGHALRMNSRLSCRVGQLGNSTQATYALALLRETQRGLQKETVALKSHETPIFHNLALAEDGERVFVVGYKDRKLYRFDDIVAQHRTRQQLSAQQVDFITSLLSPETERKILLFTKENLKNSLALARYDAVLAEKNFEMLQSLPWPIIKELLRRRAIKLDASQRSILQAIKAMYEKPAVATT